VTNMVARVALIACSAAALGLGVVGLTTPLAPVNLPAARVRQEVTRRANTGRNGIDSLVRLVVSRTPFRARRRPAAVRFDPTPATQPSELQTNTPKPTLSLSGIVWGAEPTAVVQGLPGVEGSKVVRRGDVIGGIRVSRIDRSRIWLSGLDTTWTLALKEPWK
jgi:hypothetical protein